MATGASAVKQHTLSAVSADTAQKAASSATFKFRPDVDPAAANAPQPHPELAGKRLRLPGEPAIYLIDPEGRRHYVPDPYTYNRMFRDWNGIFDDPSLN